MEKKKSKKLIFLVIIGILFIIATYFITSFYLNNQTKIQNEKNINFFKEYTIALNNIYVGSSYIALANINLEKFNGYISDDEGYYYDFAEPLASLGKEQATKSKDYLTKAKTKLEAIKDKAPNEFFKEEVSMRIEQTNALILNSNQIYSLLDYAKQQLYEINYGSKSKATEYHVKYNSLIEEVNTNLKNLSDIQNKIDLYWDQDWYVTFQSSSE